MKDTPVIVNTLGSEKNSLFVCLNERFYAIYSSAYDHSGITNKVSFDRHCD